MEKLSLRDAMPEDLELILRHRREMFREMGGQYERQLEKFEAASREYFSEALLSKAYHGTFAELEGQVVAGGGVLVADWPGSPVNLQPRRAWIQNIYVEPPHRRRGIAETIMRSLIDWSRIEGFGMVSLHASEYGRGLYDKLGFRSTNEMRLLLLDSR